MTVFASRFAFFSRSLSAIGRTALVAGCCLASLPAMAATVQVYAAASMADSLNKAAERYEQQHPDVEIKPVYASSSTLARQIAAGANAAIFISADQQWMDWLEEQGVALDQRADLLSNALVLIAPSDSNQKAFVPDRDHPLLPLLGEKERLSVGDPSHVPAGIYAKAALESLGQWQALEPRLARASDVRGALAMVERGEAPLGIVYGTDAKVSDKVKTLGTFPASSHPPVTYPVALIGHAPTAEAKALREWLAAPEAMKIFTDYGFDAASGHDAAE